MGDVSVAFIASGGLFLKQGAQEPRALRSPFAEEVRTRAGRIAARNEWKNQGSGATFQRGMLWGLQSDDPMRIPVRFTAVARGAGPHRLVYAIASGRVSGVFQIDARASDPASSEQRLFHTADLRVEHLFGPEQHGYLCCSVQGKTHPHIAVLNEDGSDVTELTEGDSVDVAPSWVPGVDRQLVFQMAGVGRDAEGRPIGLSPFAIQRLDIPAGTMTTELSDPKHDLLGPRVTASGDLICIRRPHVGVQHKPSALTALGDMLMFPFRVIFALLQWLNFFTASYTGKPLTTAGDNKQKGADARQMMIWGNLVDARDAARDAERYGDDAGSVVPRTWQLVRLRKGQTEPEVLARGVVCFDVAESGDIYFSNGNAIYRLADGRRDKVASAEEITHLTVLG